MSDPLGVSVRRPQRQSRLSIQSGRQVPTDFRYPGEPEEGTFEQMQSWIDAGQDARNFLGDIGNWFQERTAGRTWLTPGGKRNLGLDRTHGIDPLEDARNRGQFDFLDGIRNWWEGLVAEANANPPSAQDIAAGAGVGAFNDPLNLTGGSFMDYLNAAPPVAGLRGIGSEIGSWFRQAPEGGAADMVDMSGAGVGASPDKGVVEEPTPGRTVEELIALAAQYAPQGPDYSAARQQLMADTEALNAQLQAMYAAAAERAGENVSRLGDIYGGSRAGISEAYDVGTGNIEQAYQSAQQQAADQLARLGIEAAAPPVIDPMALSQAESVAGLEAGRAAGLSANERFGGAAQDFASQMAQVAQQEGLGYNQALLAALQGRLGNLAIREAEAQAQYNPLESALQYLQLEQALNPPEQGPDLDFEFRRDQANIDNYWRAYDSFAERNPGLSEEELHARVRDYILTGAMGEDIYNWVAGGNAPTPGLGGMIPMNVPNTTAPGTGGIPFFSNIRQQFSNIFPG